MRFPYPRPASTRLGRRRRAAFTLIELIVVVIIIGILATIGAVAYNTFVGQSRNTALLASATSLSRAVTASAAKNDLSPDGAASAAWAGGGQSALLSTLGASYAGTIAYTPGFLDVTDPNGARHACITLPTSVGPTPTVALGACTPPTPPEPAPTGLTVAAPAASFVYTNQTPGASAGGSSTLTLGEKFSVSSAVTVSALRFYADTANTSDPSNAVTLWSSSGTILAQGTVPRPRGAGGWFSYTLSSPVTVAAGQTVIATVQIGAGGPAGENYSYSPSGGPTISSGPVTETGAVYAYTASATAFPTSTSGNNYFVDLSYATAAMGGQPLSWTAVPGATSYTVLRNGTAIGTTASTTYRDTTGVAGTSYTYTVTATGPNGTSPSSNSVTITY